MKDLIKDVRYNPADVINQAVGSSKEFCMGYLNPSWSGLGYISTMKLSVGAVDVTNLDEVTEIIVSYDRCEKNDAYIGQINMLTASSFCGLNGALWGLDLAVADDIANGKHQPMYWQSQPEGAAIPVYNCQPLLDAAERLFGRVQQRRFPPMPGAHVVCANKSVTAAGPLWVWSSIGIAILKDRSSGACLFVEDANTFGNKDTTEAEVVDFLDKTQRKVTNSMALCGQDQQVEYEKIYVGYKYKRIEAGQVGCALTCAPYILLAQNAIPAGQTAAGLMNLTISEWEAALGLDPLE